jgi:hypothetical protein
LLWGCQSSQGYVAVPTLQFGLNTSHIDAYSVGSGGTLNSLGATDDSLGGGISGIVAH